MNAWKSWTLEDCILKAVNAYVFHVRLIVLVTSQYPTSRRNISEKFERKMICYVDSKLWAKMEPRGFNSINNTPCNIQLLLFIYETRFKAVMEYT